MSLLQVPHKYEIARLSISDIECDTETFVHFTEEQQSIGVAPVNLREEIRLRAG